MTDLSHKASTRTVQFVQDWNWTSERVVAALIALAVAAAALFGVSWLAAASSDELKLGYAREDVLVDARQVAINLNSLDYQRADEGIDGWLRSSTAGLQQEFVNNRDKYLQVIKEAKRKTVAVVTDAAVAELDLHAGTARVLVGVDVTVTPEQGQPVVTRQRLQLGMARTDEGWKASKVAPVGSPTTGPN